MKKVLSLVLAALMCAAMTPAVFADEAAPVDAVIEEIAPDDAGIMLISEEEGQIVEEAPAAEEQVIDIVVMDKTIDVTPAHIAAVAAAQGLTVTAEEVAALFGETEITPASAVAVLAALGVTITEEEVVAAVYAVAAPIEKYEITEFSAGFAALICQSLNVTLEEGVADIFATAEEAGLLDVAFMVELFNTVGLPIDEAGFYAVAMEVLDFLLANYEVEETPVEEVAAEEAVEEVAEEEVAEVEEAAAIEEEIVEEEVSKYPVILEEIPTFSIFTKLLSPFIFRG